MPKSFNKKLFFLREMLKKLPKYVNILNMLVNVLFLKRWLRWRLVVSHMNFVQWFVKSSNLFVRTNNNMCLLFVVTFRFKLPVWSQKPFQTIVVMKSLEEKTHKSHIQIQQKWFMQKRKEKRTVNMICFLTQFILMCA